MTEATHVLRRKLRKDSIFRAFPERVGPRILSLERVDYFGTSEHYWVFFSKTATEGVVNFYWMQMCLEMNIWLKFIYIFILFLYYFFNSNFIWFLIFNFNLSIFILIIFVCIQLIFICIFIYLFWSFFKYVFNFLK